MSDDKPCRHCGSLEMHVCAPARRRGKAVKRQNRPRKKKSFARNFGSEARVLAVKAMGCLVGMRARERGHHQIFRCFGPVDNAHVRARGMGGCGGTFRDVVPLCRKHHGLAGGWSTSQRTKFEHGFFLDLQAEAARVAAELDGRGL